MKTMTTLLRRCHMWQAEIFVLMLVCTSGQAIALPFHVSLDTSALSGQDATLAFDFIDGDSLDGNGDGFITPGDPGVGNNSARILNFSPTTGLGSPLATPGVTGTLQGTVELTDADVFIPTSLLQPITLGSSVDFLLELTSNFNPGGAVPDSFALSLLQTDGSCCLVTTDFGALLQIGVNGDSIVFPQIPTLSVPITLSPVSSTPVPEPSTILSMALGLFLTFRLRQWRLRR